MKYIVVKTFCDNREIADKIIKNLLGKHLVAGAQLEKIESTYYWKNELVKSDEYKLEFRTKSSLFKEIEKEIKKVHNYEVPEISSFKIEKANQDFLKWIDENTK